MKHQQRHVEDDYRGNLAASMTVVAMPSLARTEAVYDPAGPPPMTRTVVCEG